MWHPEKYTKLSQWNSLKKIKLMKNLLRILEKLGIEDKFRRHNVKRMFLKFLLKTTMSKLIWKQEKEIVSFVKRQSSVKRWNYTKTHRTFGFIILIFCNSLILIALTGTLIKAGKFSWKNRGWKLAVAGVVFPLLFLFLF
jgi:hypothetical protein